MLWQGVSITYRHTTSYYTLCALADRRFTQLLLQLTLHLSDQISQFGCSLKLKISTSEIHLASQIFDKALVFVLGDFAQVKLGRVILFLRDDRA